MVHPNLHRTMWREPTSPRREPALESIQPARTSPRGGAAGRSPRREVQQCLDFLVSLGLLTSQQRATIKAETPEALVSAFALFLSENIRASERGAMDLSGGVLGAWRASAQLPAGGQGSPSALSAREWRGTVPDLSASALWEDSSPEKAAAGDADDEERRRVAARWLQQALGRCRRRTLRGALGSLKAPLLGGTAARNDGDDAGGSAASVVRRVPPWSLCNAPAPQSPTAAASAPTPQSPAAAALAPARPGSPEYNRSMSLAARARWLAVFEEGRSEGIRVDVPYRTPPYKGPALHLGPELEPEAAILALAARVQDTWDWSAATTSAPSAGTPSCRGTLATGTAEPGSLPTGTEGRAMPSRSSPPVRRSPEPAQGQGRHRGVAGSRASPVTTSGQLWVGSSSRLTHADVDRLKRRMLMGSGEDRVPPQPGARRSPGRPKGGAKESLAVLAARVANARDGFTATFGTAPSATLGAAGSVGDSRQLQVSVGSPSVEARAEPRAEAYVPFGVRLWDVPEWRH